METSKLLPTPQARDWKGTTGKNRHSQSIADILTFSRPVHPVKVFPPPDEEKERQTTAGSGLKLLTLYESSNRQSVYWRTFSASLVLSTAWYSRNCALNWRLSVTKYKRTLFRLLPSMRHTAGTDYGLLRTPLVHEPGVPPERLVTKDGQPYQIGQTAYDSRSGHHARVGLSQQLGSATGGKLRLQPALPLWMMGLPETWLDFPMEAA